MGKTSLNIRVGKILEKYLEMDIVATIYCGKKGGGGGVFINLKFAILKSDEILSNRRIKFSAKYFFRSNKIHIINISSPNYQA